MTVRVAGADRGTYTVISLPSGIVAAEGAFTDGTIGLHDATPGFYAISVTTLTGIRKTVKLRL